MKILNKIGFTALVVMIGFGFDAHSSVHFSDEEINAIQRAQVVNYYDTSGNLTQTGNSSTVIRSCMQTGKGNAGTYMEASFERFKAVILGLRNDDGIAGADNVITMLSRLDFVVND